MRATWIEAGPQGMKEARFRSRMRRRDLWTCCMVSWLSVRLCVESSETLTYVCRISFTHDNVQDGDVAAGLAWFGGDHLILRLQ